MRSHMRAESPASSTPPTAAGWRRTLINRFATAMHTAVISNSTKPANVTLIASSLVRFVRPRFPWANRGMGQSKHGPIEDSPVSLFVGGAKDQLEFRLFAGEYAGGRVLFRFSPASFSEQHDPDFSK